MSHTDIDQTQSHEPAGYRCPLCALLAGDENEWNRTSDLVAVEPLAFARISPKAWVGRAGNALVCTTDHVENLYGLSVDQNAALFGLVQRVAVAMRSSFDCEGISIRQHNEPAGDQDLWHLHVHVLPRFSGDELYRRRHDETHWVGPAERAEWADRLRVELSRAPGSTPEIAGALSCLRREQRYRAEETTLNDLARRGEPIYPDLAGTFDGPHPPLD